MGLTRVLSAAVLVGFGVLGWAQVDRDDRISRWGERGLVRGLVRQVLPGVVNPIAFSLDGRSMVAEQRMGSTGDVLAAVMTGESRERYSVVNLETGTAVGLEVPDWCKRAESWTFLGPRGPVAASLWGDEGVAIWVFDGASGRGTELARWGLGEAGFPGALVGLPGRGVLAAVVAGGDGKARLRVFGTQGALVRDLELPPFYGAEPLRATADGRNLWWVYAERTQEGYRTMVAELDLDTGRLRTRARTGSDMVSEHAVGSLGFAVLIGDEGMRTDLERTGVDTTFMKGRQAGLWVVNPGDREQGVLISEGGLAGAWVPGDTRVWFLSMEGLFLAEMAWLPLAEFEAAEREAMKRDAMSRAKQVATGLLIYGADHDDMLPPASGWEERLMPYVRNRGLTRGFIYLRNGESLEDSRGDLGFIDLGFGRAVARWDGSVFWEEPPASLVLARREDFG